MTSLRRAAAVAVWMVIGALALLASMAYHGTLPLARRAVRDTLNRYVSGEIEGELRIGRLDVVGPYRVVGRHVALYDRQGRRVTIADEVELVPDLAAALDGTLRFSSARLRHGTVRLVEGEEIPTLIELFETTTPPSPGPPFHAIVDDIRLRDVTVYGEVLGLEGIRVENVKVHGRFETEEELVVKIWSAEGDMVEPYPFDARIDRVVGRISDDAHAGVDLHVRAHAGEDRVRANVRYRVPEDEPAEAPSELDLLVHAMPVRAETLRQVGFDWAEYLRGETRGHLRLYGPPEDLRLRSWLHTEGGTVGLEGHFPEQGEGALHARTEDLELAKVVRDAPDIRVAGRSSLFVPEAEAAETRVRLDLEPFRYEGYQVPALEVEGTLGEEAFRVERAEGRYGGGRVQAAGQVDYEGRVDLNVRAQIGEVSRDPNLSRLLPGAHGRLEGDVKLTTAAEGSDRIDFEGRIILRGFRYGPFTADWLAIEGFARGDPDRPEARLDVDGKGVAVADYPLGKAEMSLRGGPRHYVTLGRFEAPGERRVSFDAEIEATRERYVLDVEQIEFAVGDLEWRGSADQIAIRPDRDVVVQRILLANGSQRLEGQGTWRFDGPEDIEVELQGFDLTGLRGIFGDVAPAVAGRADAHLQLQGDIENPELVLQGAVRDTSYRGVDDVDLAYVFTYADGRMSLDGQADLRERGSVMVTSTGIVDPTEPTLESTLENGVYEVEVALADIDLEVLHQLADRPELPRAGGKLAGRATVSGPIQAPSFEGKLRVPDFDLPGWPELSLRTDITYERGALSARAVASDSNGALVEAEGNLMLDLVHMVTHPEDAVAALETVPWRLSVRVPPRTLGELPGPLRPDVPETLEPLKVSLSGTLAGGSFRTRGDMVAHLGWDEDLSMRPCGARSRPRATLSAKLEEGTTRIEMVGHLEDRPVLLAEASATTPLDDWLGQEERPGMPSVDLSAELRELDLGKLPWACERFDGPVSGTTEVTGLFTERPQARSDLVTNRLTVRRFRDEGLEGNWSLAHETLPLEGRLELEADHQHVEGSAALEWWSGGSADVVAQVPMTWNAKHPVPEMAADAPLDLRAQLEEIPLALVLSVVPNLIDVDGTVSGRLFTRGEAREPELRGHLDVNDGFFKVMPMGQQIGGVKGAMIFHGDWVELRQLVAREHGGELHVRGAIQLAGLRPTGGQLELNAEDFPVRSEGAILTRASGTALVDANVGEDQSSAHVTLRNLSLALPDDALRSVQELEPHADVHIVGGDSRRSQADEGESDYPIVITIRSARPFWVRRSDFAALVTMDLGVTYLDPDLFVDGQVGIRRGFFEVFGKRFEVNQASLQFDGDKDINPEVNLQATHTLRAGSADTVTVTVTGRLARPRVQFQTTVAECQERGEIIAMLVTGRCGRSGGGSGTAGFEQAGQEAASFLAGVAYGVLTLSAREEFGENFPVIVIESGALGRPKARIGIDASAIIPKALRPFVQSAYVEGFFTAQSGDQGRRATASGSRDNGFLLELQFPRNIVGTGMFSPPDNWSVDLTWEP